MAESTPLLKNESNTLPPLPTFALARDTPQGKRPQAIAHRGYKALYPENTMLAFKAAVEVGAHAIETDLHLSKDGVAVLSHDPTLKRCFGKDAAIADCTWEYIQTLRTSKAPHEPMPCLKDLLEYLTMPGLEEIWILLDIKVPLPTVRQEFTNDRPVLKKLDEHVDELFSSIASTLAEVKGSRPWNQRVLVGCWAARYLPLCIEKFPSYPITHIGFSVDYARQFLQVPRVGVNMFQLLIVGPRGDWFLRDVTTRKETAVLLWTVNEESWMKWSIRRNPDGVITDDPKKFLQVCERYESKEWLFHSWASWKPILYQHLRMMLWGMAFRYKHGFWVDMGKIRKALRG